MGCVLGCRVAMVKSFSPPAPLPSWRNTGCSPAAIRITASCDPGAWLKFPVSSPPIGKSLIPPCGAFCFKSSIIEKVGCKTTNTDSGVSAASSGPTNSLNSLKRACRGLLSPRILFNKSSIFSAESNDCSRFANISPIPPTPVCTAAISSGAGCGAAGGAIPPPNPEVIPILSELTGGGCIPFIIGRLKIFGFCIRLFHFYLRHYQYQVQIFHHQQVDST